jgi:hypothetical protein
MICMKGSTFYDQKWIRLFKSFTPLGGRAILLFATPTMKKGDYSSKSL